MACPRCNSSEKPMRHNELLGDDIILQWMRCPKCHYQSSDIVYTTNKIESLKTKIKYSTNKGSINKIQLLEDELRKELIRTGLIHNNTDTG